MVRPRVEFTHMFIFEKSLKFGWEISPVRVFAFFKSSWRNQILVHRTKMEEEMRMKGHRMWRKKRRVGSGSGSSGHTTINKIRVNKINCSTYILLYVITIGYFVCVSCHWRRHACMFVRPAKDQDEKRKKKNIGPLLFDRSLLGFNVGQVFKFFRLVHAWCWSVLFTLEFRMAQERIESVFFSFELTLHGHRLFMITQQCWMPQCLIHYCCWFECAKLTQMFLGSSVS